MEKNPEEDLFAKFNEISEKIIENSEVFPDDERLYVNTKRLFIPPFYQIFDKSSKAMMEAILRATIRIYIMDIMLKGLPVFQQVQSKLFQKILMMLSRHI